MHKSIYRIKFDPGGSDELVLVDWLDKMPNLISLPWQQKVDRPAFVEGNYAGVRPLGGVTREIVVGRIVDYADLEAAQADLLSRDVALPSNLKKGLDIRTLDISQPTTATETLRTDKLYQATECAIVSCSAIPHPFKARVIYNYQVAIGKLTEGTP